MFTRKAERTEFAIIVALITSCATAQEVAKPTAQNGCDTASWSVTRERDWFGDARLPRRESGARLRKTDRAVQLELRPTAKVTFFLPPEQIPKSSSFSGDVAFFGVPKPGLYQVTLSEKAWVEVFENGARLKAIDRLHEKDCPGIEESVRFQLAPGDLVLVEVIGATTSSIKIAFAEAQ